LSKLNMQRRIEIAAQSARVRFASAKSFPPPRPHTNGSADHGALGIGPDQTI
jgi:hypothetical protein